MHGDAIAGENFWETIYFYRARSCKLRKQDLTTACSSSRAPGPPDRAASAHCYTRGTSTCGRPGGAKCQRFGLRLDLDFGFGVLMILDLDLDFNSDSDWVRLDLD